MRRGVIPGWRGRDASHTLEGFGLHWDGAVEYQSARTETMRARSRLSPLSPHFQCSCSRRERTPRAVIRGRAATAPGAGDPPATRFRVEDRVVSFEDRAQVGLPFPLGERGGCHHPAPGRRVRLPAGGLW